MIIVGAIRRRKTSVTPRAVTEEIDLASIIYNYKLERMTLMLFNFIYVLKFSRMP
jgi:hypothetical protein